MDDDEEVDEGVDADEDETEDADKGEYEGEDVVKDGNGEWEWG